MVFMLNRLATEMNSKISADESALENISIGNRPMKLADDYHHFCSDIWLDAKQFLDDQSMEQEHAIVLLKDILMVHIYFFIIHHKLYLASMRSRTDGVIFIFLSSQCHLLYIL